MRMSKHKLNLRLVMSNHDYHAVWHKALTLLERREYGAGELYQRLLRYDFDEQLINQVIAELQRQGWQSDQRFTEMIVRTRYQQKKGPTRIRQELQQKGIENELIDDYIDEHEASWFDLAVNALSKKMRGQDPQILQDYRFKMKCLRFLYQQGFTKAHSDYALNHYLQSD